MKRSNKKGFTIVELVIVIAIIAVLAAVLIPTFAGIINKAKLSSDKQAVNQMGEQVVIALAEKEITNLDELIDVLAAAGYNAEKTLEPVSTGLGFFYNFEKNTLFLAKVADDDEAKETPTEVVFPEDSADLIADLAKVKGLKGGYKYVDIDASTSATLSDAFYNGNEKITLKSDLLVTSSDVLTVPRGADITLDLGGKKISADMADHEKHLNVLHVNGKVTIKNGTIDTRNIMVNNGGELIIESGVTVNALDTDGGACVWVYEGGKATINGATLNTSSFTYAIKCYGDITINENTVINAARGAVAADAGTVVINGGTFNVAGHADPMYAVYAYNGNAIVNGGTFVSPNNFEFLVDAEGTGSITIKTGVAGVTNTDLVLTTGQNYDVITE